MFVGGSTDPVGMITEVVEFEKPDGYPVPVEVNEVIFPVGINGVDDEIVVYVVVVVVEL